MVPNICFIVTTLQTFHGEMFCLKTEGAVNIYSRFVTAAVSHLPIGWLKLKQFQNILDIVVTFETFQFEISVLKSCLSENRLDMSVMAETSHVFMSEQDTEVGPMVPTHPFTAVTRSALVVNTRTADDG